MAPGLHARGAGAPRLAEARASAHDTSAGSHVLGGDGGFRCGDLCTQLGEERRRIADLGREREGQRHRRGHRTVGAENHRPAGAEYPMQQFAAFVYRLEIVELSIG